jgi:protein TonB
MALGLMILFMIVAIQKRSDEIPDMGPLFTVDYVHLPGEKKPQPPRAEPATQKEIEQPVAAQDDVPTQVDEPLMPMESPALTPAAESEPAATMAQTAAPAEPRRISSSQELDNIDYDPVFAPQPLYPPIALRTGIEGFVDADLTIDENGKVAAIQILGVSGHPSFAPAVRETLLRWRFPPPRIKGRPLSIRYQYRVNFRMD